jgi:sugar (pentulose or hexulose) kinase
VLLPVASSGGVSLEWFRRNCMPQVDYGELNRVLAERDGCGQVLFLPYLVSGNAPEFDADATGVFWGLRQGNDAFDMARAVMEGVAFLLRKNCQSLKDANLPCDSILAVGGGTKSAIWCQMWADITGIPVKIPMEQEAACLGAAMIGAVADGHFADYAGAVAVCVAIKEVYTPKTCTKYEEKYRKFCLLYEATKNL